MKRISAAAVIMSLFSIITFASCKSSKNIIQSNNKSTASLTNTYWKLSFINGKKVETPDNAKEVHIKFAIRENRFQGFAGCNGLGGSYELSGSNGIKIRAISTKMYCDRMEVENFLTNAVTKATSYKIEGEKLVLMDDKKTILAGFDSVYF